MGKLPNSWKANNRTTRQFREQYAKLPKEIQELVKLTCLRFHENPNHPSLHHKPLHTGRNPALQPRSFSVRISLSYRAVYVVVDDVNIWYWIGSHADYNRLLGSGG